MNYLSRDVTKKKGIKIGQKINGPSAIGKKTFINVNVVINVYNTPYYFF